MICDIFGEMEALSCCCCSCLMYDAVAEGD